LLLLLPVCSVAATAPETYLRDKLAVWQHRLKLEEWSINVVVSKPSDLRPGTLGNIHWDAEKKTAVIRVLDAPDSATDQQIAAAVAEMECTIVHELVHLDLALLPKTDASRSDEEYAVNHLAEALLELDRKDLTLQAKH